jgi:hypothetical protein
VETWYRAGRHREIADYCLDDVRATAELYEKVAPSLLIFNKEFREAEERAARTRREIEAQPSLPMTFIESVTKTSIELSASLDAPEPVVVVSGSHQAIVLEKLISTGEPEEEIPSGA